MIENAETNPSTPDLADVRRSNSLGLIGMIIALIGLALDWWIPFLSSLCPLGLIVCLIALRRPPRGLSILGAIFGLIGTGLLVWRIVALSAGTPVGATSGLVTPTPEQVYRDANLAVQDYFADNGRLPSSEEARQLFAATGIGAHGVTPRFEQIADISFRITLPGEDGRFDTEDDVVREAHVGHVPGGQSDLEAIDEADEDGGG